MTASIGGASAGQGMEVLAIAMANKQQKQEGQVTLQLLQSAMTSVAPPAAVGNLGHHINIKV